MVQVESATTRYQTIHGLTFRDTPEKVRRSTTNLRAFVLLGVSNSAIGNRPLVFWVDERKGIAFAFAYYPQERKRYLYEIIVFKAGTRLRPEGTKPNSSNWRELRPYSLEAPDQKALTRLE